MTNSELFLDALAGRPFPASGGCPVCGGHLGLNPGHGPVDETTGDQARVVYCTSCGEEATLWLDSCGGQEV